MRSAYAAPRPLGELVAVRDRRRRDRDLQRTARRLLLSVQRQELPSGVPLAVATAGGAEYFVAHPSLDDLGVRIAAMCAAIILVDEPELRGGRVLSWSTFRRIRSGLEDRHRRDPLRFVEEVLLGLEERPAV